MHSGLDGRVLFTVVDTSFKPLAVLANLCFLFASLPSFALSGRCHRLYKKNILLPLFSSTYTADLLVNSLEMSPFLNPFAH